jgi:hypothetical protein
MQDHLGDLCRFRVMQGDFVYEDKFLFQTPNFYNNYEVGYYLPGSGDAWAESGADVFSG